MDHHMMLNWLNDLYDRLEYETEPKFKDILTDDPRTDAKYCAAETIQSILSVGIDEISTYTQNHGNKIDGLIENNAVAATILYAAPRCEYKTELEQRLIDTLQRYAEGAMGTFICSIAILTRFGKQKKVLCAKD